MDGSEKIIPLVIGKSAKPRCFKGINSFPTKYRSNKEAWMTTELFNEWGEGCSDLMVNGHEFIPSVLRVQALVMPLKIRRVEELMFVKSATAHILTIGMMWKFEERDAGSDVVLVN
ncbi:hypothetical protein TNCV_2242761 [Trichonephila clavipes]|nr:hypothetical protein TNCV_2242761 [Trichonephila clavipes]